jgi:hypothetical protein
MIRRVSIFAPQLARSDGVCQAIGDDSDLERPPWSVSVRCLRNCQRLEASSGNERLIDDEPVSSNKLR